MNSLTNILQDYGVDYREPGTDHHVREGWLGVLCPYCSSGKFHMGISLDARACHCWQCGRHSIFSVLMELTKEPAWKVKELLQPLDGFEPLQAKEPAGRLAIPKGAGPLLAYHKRYLEERGFNPNRLEKEWGIKGIGLSSRLSWRLWIPIHYRGQVVSWTTRICSDEKGVLRYISAGAEEEIMPHKELLYGEDFARHAVIVCEGPADVWAIGPGAVATFGISFTQQQVARIAKYPTRCICFDSQRTAQEQARKLCSLLEPFEGRTTNIVLDAKDAGSAGKKELNQLRKEFLT